VSLIEKTKLQRQRDKVAEYNKKLMIEGEGEMEEQEELNLEGDMGAEDQVKDQKRNQAKDQLKII
jgi:hypothetical protein